MNSKTIISVILGAFVVVSIVYLVLDESSSEAPSQDEQQTAEVVQQSTGDAESACAGCSDKDECGEEEKALHSSKSDKVVAAGADQSTKTRTIAYYFHGEVRCTTCRTIEQYTRQVLDHDFKDAIDNGSLKFVDINLDEEENEHYIDDYQLSSSSLVIVKMENGKQKNWKVLDEIWTRVQDEDSFKKYTRDEIGGFLKVRS